MTTKVRSMRTSNVAKYHVGQRVQGMGKDLITGNIVLVSSDNGTASGPGLLTVGVEV